MPTRLDLANALAVVAALAAGGVAAAVGTPHRVAPVAEATAGTVTDARGAAVPVRRWARIVSGSLVSDRLLLELCEPDRVLAWSLYAAEGSPVAHRHAGKPVVDLSGDVERVLALGPDLVLVSDFNDPGRTARLRERGVAVFDLGPMRGVRTLRANVTQVAALLGHPERGAALLAGFERRFAAVAADIPAARRPRGMSLNLYGAQLYGAARDTSASDVLSAAGLVDAAAERFVGWPELGAEQVLSLDPAWVVVPRGKGGALCRHPGLDALGACRTPGHIVEVDDRAMNDPTLGMLDAAEAIRDAVHGPR